MVYSKGAKFPYPILTNHSNDYKDAEFEFDVRLNENTDEYVFEIEYKISSEFIMGLLKRGSARMALVIKSKDNQFHILDSGPNPTVKIAKTRLSIGSRTVLQLMIQTTESVDFLDNRDLISFYDPLKREISVSSGMALGFSNLITFDGSQKKPYDLFERKVDREIKGDLEIKLGDETILILYKTEEMQFSDLSGGKAFNYPYIYTGLQKALIGFLLHYTENIEDGIELEKLEDLTTALDEKLFNLMRAKNVTELSFHNLDQVIYLITDNLLKRYTNAIRGIANGN